MLVNFWGAMICNYPGFLLKYRSVVPSSSGPGRLVLIQKIKGSTPFGITTGIIHQKTPRRAIFVLCCAFAGDATDFCNVAGAEVFVFPAFR